MKYCKTNIHLTTNGLKTLTRSSLRYRRCRSWEPFLILQYHSDETPTSFWSFWSTNLIIYSQISCISYMLHAERFVYLPCTLKFLAHFAIAKRLIMDMLDDRIKHQSCIPTTFQSTCTSYSFGVLSIIISCRFSWYKLIPIPAIFSHCGSLIDRLAS